MSKVDDDIKDFLVNKVGLSKEEADDALTIAEWAGAFYSGVAFLIAAYTLLDKLFGSSGNATEAKLDTLKAAINADKVSEIIDTDLKPLAAVIDNAATAAYSYRDTPSPETRGISEDNLTSPAGLNTALLTLLAGNFYRFIPTAYVLPDGSIAPWVNGRFVFGQFYHYYTIYSFSGWVQGSALTSSLFQVYTQKDKSIQYDWLKPAPLSQSQNRWDGRLCLPLVLRGITVWRTAMSMLEPFYQLSGVWIEHIDGVSQKMLDFAAHWLESVVWTREMPSLSDLQKDGLWLVPAPSAQSPGLPSEEAKAGFSQWPCGVLDPIMGVEIINPAWWKSDGLGDLEMCTEDQRAKFKQQRLLLHMQLDNENGFAAFGKLMGNVSKLRLPPTVSPSLKVHPKLLRVEHPSSGPQVIAPIPPPHFEPVTDPYGNIWTAEVHRSSVIVKAPISVQPNPSPSAPPGDPLPPRRAVSDVVFGYEIRVIPTGGTKQTSKEFKWPLRPGPGYPSLYHESDGSNRTVPYSVEKKFSKLPATTWKTATDGYFRGKADEAKGEVTFTMTVTVADQVFKHDGTDYSIHEDEIDLNPDPGPKKKKTWNFHGAIWIQIEADNEENHGRSFEVVIEVVESANVDLSGYITEDDNKRKTYTLQMPMPIDVCTAIVPTSYFFWLKEHLNVLREDAHRLGIPGPHPDPDPSLELSMWHLVLERNPALLQAHVHSFRQLTGRPGLTAEQVLARISSAASKLASQSDVFVRPRMDVAIQRDISFG